MTQQQFIETIAPSFIKWGKQYGYKIVSAAIAQACLESAYGTSTKAINANNILGMKYRPNRVTCNDGYYLEGGSEQNKDGSYTTLPSNTAWYKFATLDACIHGYYEFLNISNYAKVKLATTSKGYLEAIKAAGYATSLKYVDNVYAVVQKWGLEKYDKELLIDKGETGDPIPSLTPATPTTPNIIKKTGTANLTSKTNRAIEYIVLHYTAGTTSKKGTAQNTAAYFSKSTTKASADFIVDDVEIVQYNPDPKNRYTWAVGGSKYAQKYNSLSAKFYGQCKNANSISIEICSSKTNTKSLGVADKDWYFTEAAIQNAIILTQYLMRLYNIDINHIITHSMVTGKPCPQPWSINEAALSGWYNFLERVKGQTQNVVSSVNQISTSNTTSSTPTPTPSYIVQITATSLNVRSGPGTSYKVTTTVKQGQKYTITEEKNGWGHLKSNAGWISLKYTKKV